MKEIDSKFGQPGNADDPSKELSHASDEIFNEMTKDLRKSFSDMFAFSEQVSDKCTAFAAGVYPDVARKHAQEIENTAHQAIDKGNIDAAKHLLKRDISFACWTLGYDDTQTSSLRTQLASLSEVRKAPEQSLGLNKINSFENIFKRY